MQQKCTSTQTLIKLKYPYSNPNQTENAPTQTLTKLKYPYPNPNQNPTEKSPALTLTQLRFQKLRWW